MGGIKGGGSSDVSPDLDEVFPGLITPSFSLLRSQRQGTARGAGTRNVITRGSRSPTGGGRDAIPNIFGNFSNQVIRAVPTSGGGEGPFVLTRTGPDPEIAENNLFRGFRGLNRGFRNLRGDVGASERELRGIRSNIPGVFANTQDLRERNLALQEDVEPGFGRLTETQVRALRDREAAQQGNLREALAARRVLGSSFAQREQASLEREFGQEEERLRAESFVTELDTSRQLIDQAGQLIQLDQQTIGEQATLLGLRMGLTEQRAGLMARQMEALRGSMEVQAQRTSRELQELGISGSIINGVTASATQLAGLQAQAAAEEASGVGSVIGSVIGAGATLGAAALLA